MSDVVAEAIREVATATRQISQESAQSSTRVTRDGDHFSFTVLREDVTPGSLATITAAFHEWLMRQVQSRR